MAISAWADILGPTNAIRIRQLSRHSTDEVKTYIRNSEEANHAESIGLLGRIHIGSNWARTGNHLIRMDRDRMAREDLERLQSSSNRNFPIANRQPNVNLSTSHNMPNVSTFNEDDRSGAKPITTPLELASDYNDLLQKNMTLIQQSMLFGAGASNIPSVKHRIGFQSSDDRAGNQLSGVCSQIQIAPSSVKLAGIPSLKHSVGYQSSDVPAGNQLSGVCSQMQIAPSSVKRKSNAIDASDVPKVQAKKKKKRFRRASELGL